MSIRPSLAITFDCWSTLIHEVEPVATYERRIDTIALSARRAGVAVHRQQARAALDSAWTRHWRLWNAGTPSGADEIARWALEALGIYESAVIDDVSTELAEVALDSQVVQLDGALRTLEYLAERGVRRALICDTGLVPGRVVRKLLARTGLLPLLEVQIFSDEVGVPKPHPSIFDATLSALGVNPCDALHVGDLRRTDVAGARAFGMRTVRIRDHHDDQPPLPEADTVLDCHDQLREILGTPGAGTGSTK